jgi:hypothetical protein
MIEKGEFKMAKMPIKVETFAKLKLRYNIKKINNLLRGHTCQNKTNYRHWVNTAKH